MPVLQLLREWPPGYGGVERVAHELASVWGGDVYSFDVQGQAESASIQDPLPVTYRRRRLPSTKPIGRLQLPLPSRRLWRLLRSPQPLHGHLPSPGVLLVLVLAMLLRPRRLVTAHWHCFLEPSFSFSGQLFAIYQWLALRIMPCLTAVVTTSPRLADELLRCGCDSLRLIVLPCCLSAEQEEACLELPIPSVQEGSPLRVLFIGRLDSYKRLDWLLEALAELQSPWSLSVVGDGPYRSRFEQMALKLFGGLLRNDPKIIQFFGRLSEWQKREQLAVSDLLVLPSDRSNEAFGIVQLEAMAAGRPSLAFDQPRSGMGWVGRLPGLPWSQSRDGLVEVLQRIADHPRLRRTLSLQARERYLSLFSRSLWCLNLQRLGYEAEPGKVGDTQKRLKGSW